MARKIEVEIVGDSRDLERAFARSARSARQFDRSIQTTSRSITRGFGAVAAAVGVTAGVSGLVAAFRSSINAAKEAQVAQAQLGQALENVGISFDQNRAAIENRTQALSLMSGFDDELITQTFTSLVRTTGDVTKALDLSGLAADVARGRNISLQSATQLVTKASLGMAGALRRVGIAARTDATAVELLDLLNRKFAGSAEAYGDTAAGAQERFHVALENTQEIIGQALLPSLTRLLNKATEWLNDQDNQERLQKAVNDAADKGTAIAKGLADAWNGVSDAYNAIQDADPFGGRSIRDIAAFGKASTAMLDAQIAKWEALVALAQSYGAAVRAATADVESLRNSRAAEQGSIRSVPLPRPSGSTFLGRPLSEGEQLRAASAAARLTPGTGDDVQTLQAQRAKDQAALDFALRMIREQRGNTRVFVQAVEKRSAEIASANAQLAGIAADDAATAKTRTDLLKQTAIERADLLKQQAQTRLETKQGWLAFAVERAEDTKPIRDDVRAQRAIEKWLVGRIKQEGRKLELVSELWRTRKRIRDLNKKNGADDRDPLAGLMQISSRRMVQMLAAGTGLDIAGRHRLSSNVAGMELRPIYVGVNVDGREIGRATTKDQARTSRRTSRQTSGFRG